MHRLRRHLNPGTLTTPNRLRRHTDPSETRDSNNKKRASPCSRGRRGRSQHEPDRHGHDREAQPRAQRTWFIAACDASAQFERNARASTRCVYSWPTIATFRLRLVPRGDKTEMSKTPMEIVPSAPVVQADGSAVPARVASSAQVRQRQACRRAYRPVREDLPNGRQLRDRRVRRLVGKVRAAMPWLADSDLPAPARLV